MEMSHNKPNFLLYGFIILSLTFHVFLFLHLSGVYENRTISYIELSIRQPDKPESRKIPRPRLREKTDKIVGVKPISAEKIDMAETVVKTMDPMQIEKNLGEITFPLQAFPLAVSDLFVPVIENFDGLSYTETHEAPVEFVTAKDYFEMLHLRIQQFKKYPESAKSDHVEGKVKVQFVLSAEGTLTEIKILKSSRHKRLNRAAVDAIKDAAPFPRPPAYIFKIPMTLRIDILFELV